MKNFFTMNMNFVISKGLYLQSLILHLPEHRLKNVLIAPRKEILDNLKIKLRDHNKDSKPH
jgi:hypothetical protein